MKITICKQPNYQNNKFLILEFKGNFQSEQNEQLDRSMTHLGDIQKLTNNTYKFEIGVMDLIGTLVEINPKLYYIEKQNHGNQIKLIVKGIITKKIKFTDRPVPDMKRTQIETKNTMHTNIFRNSGNLIMKENLPN